MSGSLTDEILTELAQAIEIPDGAYEAADGRYQDLGGWLNDDSDLPPFVTPRPTKLTPVLPGAGCDGG